MTCSEFQIRLSAYLDGELSHWKRWKVQTHLRSCRECATLMRELEDVDGCLRCAAEAERAPEYLTGSVMWRLPAMPPAWRPRPLSRPVATGLALAGMQLVAIAGAYWWGFSHAATQQQPVPAGVGMTGPTLPVRSNSPAPFVEPSANSRGNLWGSPWGGSESMSATPAARESSRRRSKSSGVPSAVKGAR